MKKNIEKGLISVALITIILIVLLNIVTFAIPFNKNDIAVLITAYLISEIIIIATGVINLILLFINDGIDNKVYSLPIIHFSYTMMIVQLIFTLIIYICNAYLMVPLWLIIVIESFIIAIYTIKIIIANLFKGHLINNEEKVNKTVFMDEFRARLKAIALINQNENVEKVLNNLLETALVSDPISNENTLDSESELLSNIQELDDVIKNGSEEEIRVIIDRTTKTLLERNALCKAGK